ncbi:hypothetical protein K3495_g14331, partial [Podosphaera aphanis]
MLNRFAFSADLIQLVQLISTLKKADKTASRALIGHLVGYQGTNIFRIWLPKQDEVIVTRDVIFEPTLFYDNREDYAQRSVIGRSVELLEFPESHFDNDINIEDLLTHRQRYQDHELSPAITNTELQVGGESTVYRREKDRHDSTTDQHQRQLLTPGPSEFEDGHQDESAANDNSSIPTPRDTRPLPIEQNIALEPQRVPEGYRAYGEPAPRGI